MIQIREVTESEVKSRICEDILRALPEWFGIEESLTGYVRQCAGWLFYAAYEGDRAVGFATVHDHNLHTAEVAVMGILPDWHRHGIGRALILRCEDHCRSTGRTFLTVKTLDETAHSEEYSRTRRFYLAMGFHPLEVFPLLWDERNPCLLMAKHITPAAAAE